MNKLNRYITITLLALGLVALIGQPLLATADDTEIYVGSNSLTSTIKPNVVFIIDTSGSMNTDETFTTGTYDPATTYSGTCSSSNVYWTTNGTPPDCSTNTYFLATSNTCKASATALGAGGVGYYNTRAARYKAGSTKRRRAREDTWASLSSFNHSDYVECQDDWGIHGQSNVSTDLYPADQGNGGPWRADSTGAIDWSRTGRDYTFYNGNYLNWRNSPGVSTTMTRIAIVQKVFSNLMDSISDINVAVMRFDEGTSTSTSLGGYFIIPMQPINDSNRTDYKNAVNNLNANGSTPLAETLYESYLFYKGDPVKYGNSTSPGTNVAGVLDSSGSSYKSPIDYQCQKNFVILLTDGAPNGDTDADNDIESMTGFKAVTGSSTCNGNCLDELAQYMHTRDCSKLDGTQNVITYTIGFTTNQVLLNDAATKGGGKYYTANNTANLTDAFNSIITEIRSVNTSFIAPAVSVNSFNKFTHRDELYYALFRPELRPKWYGNIKRYKLAGDPPIIVDQNDVAAIDINTGFFKTTSTSFWTTTTDAPDGDVVEKGGAASNLTLPRTVYTYTGSGSPSNVTLSSNVNALSETNSLITKAMLGDTSMTDTYRSNLLQWARGIDLLDEDTDADTTDVRRRMGDPLHAKPVLVTYGGSNSSPDITLFVGTNEGYLQAINTTTGAEVFSFMPQELLPNIATLFENSSTDAHVYGLDGPLTTWVNDINGNGVILDSGGNTETGEFVYLYQGMRRGGKNYYALDVTNRSTPLLKWEIKGGSGDFTELAQTWSAPYHGKIKLNGVDKDVLVFGGGYDPAEDSNALAANDSEGRALFIVDAETGAKLWQAGPSGSAANGSDPDLVLSDMTNSIPATVNIIDMNLDGYIDRMYAADTRGQIWRFDIDNKNNTGSGDLVTGGIIARLGGSTADSNRRFYYTPDVSLSLNGRYLNIAIGSGYRAHPLNNTVHDAFFVIHDPNVYGPTLDSNGNPVYSAITMSDLYDATDNVLGQGNASSIAVARTSLINKQGLYIYLNEMDGSFTGEKALARSETFNGTLIFTTYKPVASTTSLCSPAQGTGRVYYINIADATPVIDANASGGDLTREDRNNVLVRGGIPPEASIIFNKKGLVGIVGTEKIPSTLNLTQTPMKTRWHSE